MYNPFLIGEQIYLRSIEAPDITPTYQGWFNDGEVCKFNDHHRFPMHPEQMREYYEQVIQSKQNLVLAIIAKEGDAHIGNISLQSIDIINRSAEFAIIVGNKEWWGKGVAREAGKLILDHGITQLNLHRIYCGTSAANAAMQELALALGFQEEGRSRDALFKDGRYHDTILYGLLASDRRA